MNKHEMFEALQKLLDGHQPEWSKDDDNDLAIIAIVRKSKDTKGTALVLDDSGSPEAMAQLVATGLMYLKTKGNSEGFKEELGRFGKVSKFIDKFKKTLFGSSETE